MGITIHYRGKLNSPELRDSVCDELTDIAIEMDWKYYPIVNNKDSVKGIIISPHPKSEALSFLFGKDGGLKDFRPWEYNNKNEEKIDDSYLSVKTQFAPIEIHIAIIKLFKYLKKKYISNLKVYDEGKYWDTEDEELLREKISFLNRMMDEIEGLLNEVKTVKGETAESFIKKIENLLSEKYGTKAEIKKIK
jgi:hypothetical protein